MLYASADLSSAYTLKEIFYRVLDTKDKEAKKLVSDWILSVQNSYIPSFANCVKTFINWSAAILNSFDYNFTNSFSEGCNNKIKALKRNAFAIVISTALETVFSIFLVIKK